MAWIVLQGAPITVSKTVKLVCWNLTMLPTRCVEPTGYGVELYWSRTDSRAWEGGVRCRHSCLTPDSSSRHGCSTSAGSAHYRRFFPGVSDDLPYFWPLSDRERQVPVN
jgi:hypothetical protein